MKIINRLPIVPLLAGMCFLILNGFTKQSQWDKSVSLYSFGQHSFETGLDYAVRAEMKNVESISFLQLGGEFGSKKLIELNKKEISKVKKMLSSRKLKMSSLYVSDAHGKEGWKPYFELAKKLKVKYLVSEPAEEDLDIINELADVYKIKVAIYQHKKPGRYWHPDEVWEAIKNRPNLGLAPI